MIHWIDLDVPGRLGIGPRPRSVEDLAEVDLVVSLLTADEFAELKLGWLESVRLPIEDRGLPVDRAAVVRVAQQVAARLREGARVLVHCRAGIGRSGMIAGCVLAELGWRSGRTILERLTAARGVGVPDTEEQAEWLAGYVRSLAAPTSLDEALRSLDF